MPSLLGEGADEVDVVGDEDEGSFEVFERGDEGFDRGEIEVGRGLIHEEEVRRVDEEFDERESAFFSSGEDSDALGDVFFLKEEGPEDGACFVIAHAAACITDFAEDGVFFVESGSAVLGEVSDLGGGADVSLTGVAFFGAGEHLHESRLTSAVWPDEDDAVLALDVDIEVLVDDFFAVGLVDILK